MDLNTNVTERALGMIWDIKNDIFKFKLKSKEYPNTKRGILSLVASIFDPLGVLTPSILEAKLIIQSLWRMHIDWDENLPPDIFNRFENWKRELNFIEQINIPRWLGYTGETNINTQLNIYCDASNAAYGVVAYFNFMPNDTTKAIFVMSKSRLIPIKEQTLTIPPLELQVAVIAVRMKDIITEQFDFKIDNVKFWTDSQIVLNYIRNTTRKFPVFVMNWLHEIRLNSSLDDWNFIVRKHNPADLCNNDKFWYIMGLIKYIMKTHTKLIKHKFQRLKRKLI